MERQAHKHTDTNWHVGSVLTSLALDKNIPKIGWIILKYINLKWGNTQLNFEFEADAEFDNGLWWHNRFKIVTRNWWFGIILTNKEWVN